LPLVYQPVEKDNKKLKKKLSDRSQRKTAKNNKGEDC
jgi:hypothetical protein